MGQFGIKFVTSSALFLCLVWSQNGLGLCDAQDAILILRNVQNVSAIPFRTQKIGSSENANTIVKSHSDAEINAIVIDSVEAHTLPSLSGLQRQDIILKINDKDIPTDQIDSFWLNETLSTHLNFAINRQGSQLRTMINKEENTFYLQIAGSYSQPLIAQPPYAVKGSFEAKAQKIDHLAVEAVPEGSILDTIGIRGGDKVLAIDSAEFKSMTEVGYQAQRDRANGLMHSLKTKLSGSITLERNGRRLVINYNLVQG